MLHKIIDKLNANLRSIDTINDKVRVREFYLISLEDAYELLEDIAIISGTKERLHLYKPTKEEVIEDAEKNRELSKNRHHFKEVKFKSSLTNKTYYSKTKDDEYMKRKQIMKCLIIVVHQRNKYCYKLLKT